MAIYKKTAPAFLLLAQLVVLICLSGKLCAGNHHTGNYYRVTDKKSGKGLYFYSDIPVNIDLLQRSEELLNIGLFNRNIEPQIEAFSLEPQSPLEFSLEVYRFSGGLNFNLNSHRRSNPEALSQEYTTSIAPVIRTLLTRSAHERFGQPSTPPDSPQRGRDTHVVTIYVVLPGSYRVSSFMDNLAREADTLVNNNVANSWQPGEIAFREPNRPVLSLMFYVHSPYEPPPATSVESVHAAVPNRATGSGSGITGIPMSPSLSLLRSVEQAFSEPPARENRHQRAYCRQNRALSPHGQLQFNVEMPADSKGSAGSAERVEQIIRAFTGRTRFRVSESALLPFSSPNEALAGAFSQGENPVSSRLLTVGFTESFFSDGIEQRGGSDIVHFYPPRENPPTWLADNLHSFRRQVELRLDRVRALNRGSQEYLIREAESPGNSRRHFKIAIALPPLASNLDSGQVPFSIEEWAMSRLLVNIQCFLSILEQDQHLTFSWRFHDVNYTGSRLEVTFFLTSYVRGRDSGGGITNISIQRLNRLSPDDWHVREWTPLYISTFTPEPAAAREPHISLLDGLRLRVLHGVGVMRRWARRLPGRHSGQRQERVGPEVQEQLGGLLGAGVQSKKL